jgi:hypothetical protein
MRRLGVMRATILALLVGAVVALPAGAAEVDPAMLVVGPTDVPGGYRLVRSESGLRTNTAAAREIPELAHLFRKWGRVTGYQRIFDRGERSIEARVDLFRSPAGAGSMFAWSEIQIYSSGAGGVRVRKAGIGTESLIASAASPSAETYAYWRHGRAWAALGGPGLTRATVLTLARKQQRRIAAALG